MLVLFCNSKLWVNLPISLAFDCCHFAPFLDSASFRFLAVLPVFGLTALLCSAWCTIFVAQCACWLRARVLWLCRAAQFDAWYRALAMLGCWGGGFNFVLFFAFRFGFTVCVVALTSLGGATYFSVCSMNFVSFKKVTDFATLRSGPGAASLLLFCKTVSSLRWCLAPLGWHFIHAGQVVTACEFAWFYKYLVAFLLRDWM